MRPFQRPGTVTGFGFRVQGIGFQVSGSGSRVPHLGSRVSGSGSRFSGFGFRACTAQWSCGVVTSPRSITLPPAAATPWAPVCGFGFRVQDFGFQISCLNFGRGNLMRIPTPGMSNSQTRNVKSPVHGIRKNKGHRIKGHGEP